MSPYATVTPPASALAFVALGSNLGDSRRIVLEAMTELEALSAHTLRRSSLWQTSPVECPPGSPPFVNAVVGFVPRPTQTPLSILDRLQALEKEFGRLPKKQPNEPRPLDLDLIACPGAQCVTERLILPHPRAHQRRFVLQPLQEIAPDLILPGQTLTVTELLEALASAEILVRLEGASA